MVQIERSLVVLKKKSLISRLIDIGLIAITIIAIIVLGLSTIIIAKKKLFPDKVPDVGGIKPFIVLSESMEPFIKKGDLVFIKEISPNELNEGDIIAFRHTKDDIITLHRIVEKMTNENEINFRTKGDNNEGEDRLSVKASEIEGIFIKNIEGLGNVAMFIRTPQGSLCAMLSVISIFLIWQFVKTKKVEKILHRRLIEYEEIIEEINKERI